MTVMGSSLYFYLLFSGLCSLCFCVTRQFYVVNEKKNWNKAQKYCREKYTDLATIESQEEMAAVKTVLNGTQGHFLIGLRQNETTLTWVWSDGSNSSFRDWKNGEPNNHGSDNCVELQSENKYMWNDLTCYTSYSNPFVCYKNVFLILVNQNKTWWDALGYCRQNHLDLVSVHTVEDQQLVKLVAKNATTANVWMGLHHSCILNLWFWTDGEPLCYQNWAPGNGTGVEVCTGGDRSGAIQSGSKQWISLLETQKLNFICIIKG
ncbi:macrophage mannose receptor 1-like [Hoplias malabaricus]|uniref:macrophage mannose receptor 1-like n=1 Tax=Hoplias malabaricus TaxID=27720 RepID=UPI003462BC0F